MGGFPSQLFGRYEFQRYRIYAMPGIFFREAFSQKYMPQVTLTIGTDDLCSPAVRIQLSDHGAFNLIIKAGPSAMAVEFIV